LANREHLATLLKGRWNAWRKENESITPNLRGANLRRAKLDRFNLNGVDLRGANLSGARLDEAELKNSDLSGCDLSDATLIQTNLEGAILKDATLLNAALRRAYLSSASFENSKLQGADFSGAVFGGANLSGTWLNHANFTGADLRGVRFNRAHMYETMLADVDLTGAIGLESCNHHGPSIVDFRTLKRSADVPAEFLRGVGFSDEYIEYVPSLLSRAIELYSCFISYSTRDEDFAKKLYGDLQKKGVRCWFAPHDLVIGGKLLDEIDAAIRMRDKVLLILSKHSIDSDWVEDEVTKAFEEERRRKQEVLFPIRIDDAVLSSIEPWAAKVRARLIGDFTNWKIAKDYEISLRRVVRDLLIPKEVNLEGAEPDWNAPKSF
jgi:TIR domain/Pentapeptide repeats (8 copies)